MHTKTEEMKEWQKGFSIDYLLHIEGRYKDYNSRALGPFSAVKKHIVARLLKSGAMQLTHSAALCVHQAKASKDRIHLVIDVESCPRVRGLFA